MTSYRAPLGHYHERKASWEGLDPMPQRDYDDHFYDHSQARYRDDSDHPLYGVNEGYLEDERREYIDYRDEYSEHREQDGYRHFEREARKSPPPPLFRDFRRNEESSRDLDPDMSRESRFFDRLDEYIREQRELKRAEISRERGPRSLLDLETIIPDDSRSRDHVEDRGYRSRDYPAEERSRDRDYRSHHGDDYDYHRSDYSDDYGYRRNERRSRIKEPDYHGNEYPGRHGYYREQTHSDPYYQRDGRSDYDNRSEDIVYGYRDRHRRFTERELRKQMDGYDAHVRANPSPKDRGRQYPHVDKHSYASRIPQDDRTTRPGMRGHDKELRRESERGDARYKRRLTKDEYERGSRHTQRQRYERRSRSPGISGKVHSRSSSPARKSPLSSGKAEMRDKNPKRRMPSYETNGTKRRKGDERQTNPCPKSQDAPSAELITRDQFLSRDVFTSQSNAHGEPEGKSKSSDIEFRDSNLSRSSCEEGDLRHELSFSRASEKKVLDLNDPSGYEEQSTTASSNTRNIDSEPSAIRSIVQIPSKKTQDHAESGAKNNEEVERHSAQVRRSMTPDPVIKSRVKQVSTLPSAEPLPVTMGQPAKTSEVLKRKVSICSGRAASPLLGEAEKPKVELPADDLRLLIMSRRLRQNEETTPSLDEKLAARNKEPLLSTPRSDHQCQVSSERQGSTDRMVELSYSDPEASANEDSTPPTPTNTPPRKVVMRREVILDYGHKRSHPTAVNRT